MKILKTLLWSILILPILIIIAKLLGLIALRWIIVLMLSTGYPLLIVFGLMILSIWIIKNIPPQEWNE